MVEWNSGMDYWNGGIPVADLEI